MKKRLGFIALFCALFGGIFYLFNLFREEEKVFSDFSDEAEEFDWDKYFTEY